MPVLVQIEEVTRMDRKGIHTFVAIPRDLCVMSTGIPAILPSLGPLPRFETSVDAMPSSRSSPGLLVGCSKSLEDIFEPCVVYSICA